MSEKGAIQEMWKSSKTGAQDLMISIATWVADTDFQALLSSITDCVNLDNWQAVWSPVMIAALLALTVIVIAARTSWMTHSGAHRASTSAQEAIPAESGRLLRWIEFGREQRIVLEARNAQLQSENVTLKDMIATHKTTAAKLGQQQAMLQNQNTRLDKEINKAKNKFHTEQARCNKLQAQIQAAAQRDNHHRQALATAHQHHATLSATVTKAQTERDGWYQQYVDLKYKYEAVQEPATDSALRILSNAQQNLDVAMPFVMVLVDGDAYSFNSNHYTQKNTKSGASAAHAIKTEVQQYLLQNRDVAPLQSKIVTRVLHNMTERFRTPKKDEGITIFPQTPEFVLTFTESMPLFDYVDCGRGKERADSKIQENFHLFITNPSCRCIFLAATRDNGFARMLEQYSTDDQLKKKVVLVHPGYVIPEIADLGYNAVEWSSVFTSMRMPGDAKAKLRRVTERQKVEGEQMALAVNKCITQGAFPNLTGNASPKRPQFVTRSSSWRPGMEPEVVRDEGLFEEVD